MPQSYSRLYYHIVFSTKHREESILPGIRPRLYEYFSGIHRNKDCHLIKAGGTSDHVHLLSALSREQTVAGFLRDLKTSSSKWIHDTFQGMQEFAWQRGYGAFTVSYGHVERITKYIENQEEHHRRESFKVEYVAFLDAHDVEYNEAYLWE